MTINGRRSTFSPLTVSTGGVAFDPLQSGSTTVAASAPGFITTTAGVVAGDDHA